MKQLMGSHSMYPSRGQLNEISLYLLKLYRGKVPQENLGICAHLRMFMVQHERMSREYARCVQSELIAAFKAWGFHPDYPVEGSVSTYMDNTDRWNAKTPYGQRRRELALRLAEHFLQLAECKDQPWYFTEEKEKEVSCPYKIQIHEQNKVAELQAQMSKELAAGRINQGTCANVNKLLILAEARKIEPPRELQIRGRVVAVIWRTNLTFLVHAKTSLSSIQRALAQAETYL